MQFLAEQRAGNRAEHAARVLGDGRRHCSGYPCRLIVGRTGRLPVGRGRWLIDGNDGRRCVRDGAVNIGSVTPGAVHQRPRRMEKRGVGTRCHYGQLPRGGGGRSEES